MPPTSGPRSSDRRNLPPARSSPGDRMTLPRGGSPSRPASVRVGVAHPLSPTHRTRSRLARSTADRRLFGSALLTLCLQLTGPEVGWPEAQPTGVCSGRRCSLFVSNSPDPKSAGQKHSRPASVRVGVRATICLRLRPDPKSAGKKSGTRVSGYVGASGGTCCREFLDLRVDLLHRISESSLHPIGFDDEVVRRCEIFCGGQPQQKLSLRKVGSSL